MRKRYIIMFVVGAAVLLATLGFGLPVGMSGVLGPMLLIALAAKGAWSDHQKAEQMGGTYTHQRSGSGKTTGKYHDL